MHAFIQIKNKRPDGTYDAFSTVRVPCKIKRLWWQEQGLQYTATGYGSRIPMQYMVQWEGKWRRVYCCIYSNAGTCYIGKLSNGLFLNDTIED